MNLGVSFAPLVPAYAIWAAIGVAVAISALLLLTRGRGALVRAVAMALMILALANPSLTREDRDPIPSVAAVIVDKSPSQEFGDREKQTEAARAALVKELQRIPGLEVRTANASEADGENDGTKLFSALSATLADVPPDRIAGTIMITDGRVHDVPANAKALGFSAPVHALITGHPNEIDRRVVLTQTPRFGIVNQSQTIGFHIEDHGSNTGTAEVTVRRDGEVIDKQSVAVGADIKVKVPIPHAGPNIVEVEASPIPNELTQVNNRAVVSIDGVRDKLRVLLVSGEPHPGERTWRNLLKSDASVDLVHFTILRPPEKQDGTPINELSLIAFPTRELFQQKISQFQLIIFDRYARQGVLPTIYFDNIAKYVRDGGALLIAAGPEYGGPASIWRTPLDVILPAEPSGGVTEKPFRAALTKLGERHPVTRGLEGSQTNPPHWSQWFRVVDTHRTTGTSVLQGPDNKPLLVLAHEGKGRVAMLLSDQIWLWARGYEGGGPDLDLLRRLSHWLMKQPDLDEEALRLSVHGRDLAVTRQTMADTAEPVTLTSPTGKTQTLTLKPDKPGLWQASITAKELGLWRATDGKLTALVNVGPANPREFQEVTSTTDVLHNITAATGGSARRLAAGGNGLDIPRVVPVHSGSSFQGQDWIGLRMRDVSVVRGIGVLPIFAGLIGLLLLIGSLAAAWAREGR
ncbi:MAG TPA: hypothetical protein VFT69_19675 [Pseudolabrys sp.]|nr:hypothetical protein [Pseudolabrys sp.]